jgi:hypothetical protein
MLVALTLVMTALALAAAVQLMEARLFIQVVMVHLVLCAYAMPILLI